MVGREKEERGEKRTLSFSICLYNLPLRFKSLQEKEKRCGFFSMGLG